jgi:cytochrome c
MRAGPSIALAPSAAAILLSCSLLGCSKPAAPGDAGGSTTAAAAAPAPTDAQKKAILATLPAAYQSADLDNGQAKFATCKSCHTIAQGGDTMVGPNLWGVFGRKAGSLPGFAYSGGMKALGITWDADRINTWITRPSAMVPGTKMTYVGMENPKDRVDVIAYLKTVTTTPTP